MQKNPSLTDIRARRKAIADTIADLQAEDRDLVDLETALERFAKRYGQLSFPAMLTGGAEADTIATAAYQADQKQRKTNQDFVIQVLKSGDLWMTAVDLRKAVSELKGVEVPMSTVSPLLTYLKNLKKITRHGMKVALTERLKEGADTNQAAE